MRFYNSVTKAGFSGCDLTGRVALITGAANGIGLSVASLFAAAGARLALLDCSPAVQDLPATLSADASLHLALQVDVSDSAALEQAVAHTIAHFGRIDILINNAGVALLGEAASLSDADWNTTLAVNLTAPFVLSQAVGRHMLQRCYGRIINLASQASVVALQRHAAYCSSKAGLVAMSKVLAVEWGRSGITVNSVSPTVVETELGKTAWAGEPGRLMKSRIPVGRFAAPEEVAGLILYLSSEAAGMINGENILIDGGYCAQ